MSYFIIFIFNGLLFLHHLAAGENSAVENATESDTNPHLEAALSQDNRDEDTVLIVGKSGSDNDIENVGWEFENTTEADTRRILYGKRVKGKRNYMVYLQLTQESAKAHKYRGWLCGGVIVHESYVLTSAACVEDADHFYIVSGTTKFVDSFDYKTDKCVCKHRRRVVWKCIPKNYKFDFEDSIKWSSNDIAIVKVDKPFKFGVQEEGCEHATCAIRYNNVSKELEKAGTKSHIVGWGTMGNFREGVYKRAEDVDIPKNSKYLQQAKVCIMDNEQCAKKWAQRFRSIITQYMICTKDVMKRLSEICDKKYANCTDVEKNRRTEDLDLETVNTTDVNSTSIDLGHHLKSPSEYAARRSNAQGGFCENDHGGPLIVKYKKKEYVIGVISACKIDPKSHSCHGPFLYTSVYCNRQFLSCSIHKDVEQTCRRVFRTGITHEEYNVDWSNVKEDKEDDDDDDDNDNDDRENDSKEESEAGVNIEDDDDTEVLRGSRTKHEKVKDVKEAAGEAEGDKKTHDDDSKEEKVKKTKKQSKKKTVRKNKKSEKEEDKVLTYESSSDEKVNEPQDIKQ